MLRFASSAFQAASLFEQVSEISLCNLDLQQPRSHQPSLETQNLLTVDSEISSKR